jgi:hypothetical protein
LSGSLIVSASPTFVVVNILFFWGAFAGWQVMGVVYISPVKQDNKVLVSQRGCLHKKTKE